MAVATEAGFDPQHIGFVTAYMDRSAAAFKKTMDALAWNSFAWFVSEPGCLVSLRGETRQLRLLSEFMGQS